MLVLHHFNHKGAVMKSRTSALKRLLVPMVLAAMMLPGEQPSPLYAAEKKGAMTSPPHKVEITIRDRQHGYETVGLTTPAADTTIVVRNLDSVTHGFASTLFKEVSVRMEGGVEVRGKNFKSFHVDPGKSMTLHFSTAPSKFDPATGIAETARYVLWCDVHPEVKGELYIIETKGEIGGG